MPTDLNFDAHTVPPSSPFEPLPANTYRAHITESEVKPASTGKGHYLQLTWEVLDGEYKGRKFWDRLNIQNENRQAQEIAQRALSAICHASGVMRLSNSSQLHHIPVMVKLSIRQDKGYEPTNVVKGYKACEGTPGAVALPRHGTTAHGGEQAAAVAPAPTATTVPPWAQKAS